MSTENKTDRGPRRWFVADGWIPVSEESRGSGYQGHEAMIILNCNDVDAHVCMDVYFDDREPATGIPLIVPARRVKCFRMDHPDEIGGLDLGRLTQYALRLTCDEELTIQFGRMDVTQPNLAYLAVMAEQGRS
jgi:hypothetical protein